MQELFAPTIDDLIRCAERATELGGELYAVYCRLRDRGKLPPRWEPPPKPKAG
jgi:hypothetical protein